MTKLDTRDDLPGALCFERAYGNCPKIWVHPSVIGAVEEEEYNGQVRKMVSIITFRSGYEIHVKGTAEEILKKLGWK